MAGVAGLIGLVVALLVREREPVVNGRTVTEWAYIKAGVKKLPAALASGPSEDQLLMDAEVALQQAGKAGVPALARLLKARESGWYGKFVRWSRHQSWFPGHLITAEEKQYAGLVGLALLGTNAASALPEIAPFAPNDNHIVHFYYGQIAHRLAARQWPVTSGLYMSQIPYGWIYPSPSNSRSMFVCAAFVFDDSPPYEKTMKIGLRHTDGRLQDWIQIQIDSPPDSKLALAQASQAGGEGFEVRFQGIPGPISELTRWPLPLEIRSSGTNFTTRLEKAESVFRFRVVNDRFVFPAADGK